MSDHTTETLHPSSVGLHTASASDVFTRLLDAQIAAISTIRPALPALSAAAEAGADALRQGFKMGYAGAGSSGLMALADCLELWGTFGIPVARTPMLFAGGAAALMQMTGAVEDDPAQVFAVGGALRQVSLAGALADRVDRVARQSHISSRSGARGTDLARRGGACTIKHRCRCCCCCCCCRRRRDCCCRRSSCADRT